MGAPETDELGEDLKGLRFEMVFDGLDLLLHGVGTQAEKIDHCAEGLMADLMWVATAWPREVRVKPRYFS